MEKIELSKFTEAVNAQNKNEVLQIMWPGGASEKLAIFVKPTLSFAEVLTFVNDVVNLCFGENDEYNPEIKDFAIKRTTLDMYTNIELPTDPVDCYQLIYESDIFDEVFQRINNVQFEEMIQAINDKIDYKAQTEISAIRNQLADLFKTYDALQEKISAMISGVKPEDITNIISAVANGSFDTDKLVESMKKQHDAEKKVVPITKKDE